MTTPLIFDIVRGSMNDGPGIRTTVYFKGCPFSCIWCHRPASVAPQREVVWQAKSCIGCDACRDCCLQPDGTEGVRSWRGAGESCRVCGACVASCPTGALAVCGREYPVEELVPILLEDGEFQIGTGGGVTVVPGDATLHCGYLSLLLSKLKERGTHIVLQTGGLFDFETFRTDLLPFLDLVYFDLKFIDPTAHLIYTGVSNDSILANFRLLAHELGERLIPRVPMVQGITATEENLSEITAFLREVGGASSVLLPYFPGRTTRATLPAP